MVLKTISPGCVVWASLMLFFFCFYMDFTILFVEKDINDVFGGMKKSTF